MSFIETGTPRVSDSNLLKIFIDKTLLNFEELGLTNQARLVIMIQNTPYIVLMSGTEQDDENNCFVKDGKIDHPFLNSLRGQNCTNNQITKVYLQDKGIHDALYFEYCRSTNSLVDTIKTKSEKLNSAAIKVIGHISGLLTESPIGGYSQSPEFDIASVHHDVLTRLEGLSLNLIEKQNEQIKRLDEEKKAFIDDQLEEFSQKVTKLESEHKDKLTGLEESYQARSTELDEREKEIEDADNTTARRKTTTSILDEVQAKARRFDFSVAVTRRSLVACFFAILLGFIGGFNAFTATNQLYSSIQNNSSLSGTIAKAVAVQNTEIMQEEVKAALSKQVNDSQQFMWFLYIKIFFSSALLVSSIIYLIKWFNSWADRLAQQELDNQLFVRDLNRAHLAIEMSLEWNEKKDGAIPDRLLQSLTDNLFQTADSTPKEILHPAEQLASALVRSADKINVPFAGGNLEVSGKKLGKTKSAVNDG
ncbi:TPA: hypothetical protein KDZ07_004710 [Vibrio parahaemolyticus]|nr:hypothetical protein [Vibrio parahaemolyticus]HBC3506712.1 hypothetical protein [Vibrio parahaemolyticus]